MVLYAAGELMKVEPWSAAAGRAVEAGDKRVESGSQSDFG